MVQRGEGGILHDRVGKSKRGVEIEGGAGGEPSFPRRREGESVSARGKGRFHSVSRGIAKFGKDHLDNQADI